MSIAQSSWVKTIFAASSLELIRCPPSPCRPISTLNSRMSLLLGIWVCGSLRRFRAAATRRETCHQLTLQGPVCWREESTLGFIPVKQEHRERRRRGTDGSQIHCWGTKSRYWRPPGPGTPLLGVWWCILPKRIQRDPLAGWLPRKSGVFSPETFLQRSRGFLCLCSHLEEFSPYLLTSLFLYYQGKNTIHSRDNKCNKDGLIQTSVITRLTLWNKSLNTASILSSLKMYRLLQKKNHSIETDTMIQKNSSWHSLGVSNYLKDFYLSSFNDDFKCKPASVNGLRKPGWNFVHKKIPQMFWCFFKNIRVIIWLSSSTPGHPPRRNKHVSTQRPA